MLTITGAMDTAKHTLTSRLADHFRIAERNTTLRTEVVGGVTTFAVMAYIIFLNPFILTLNGSAQAPKVPPFAGLVTATCLAAAIMSIAMGLYANYPFALAPGLGINSVIAFDLIATHALPWQAAMGVIFVGGILITGLVLAGFGDALLRAIPLPLKRAIGVGIGLFILFIGLLNAGVVRVPVETITISGAASFSGPTTLGTLATQDVRLGSPGTPVTLGALTRLPVALAIVGLLLVMFSLMLSGFLDTVGTIVGVGERAGLVDAQGRLPGAQRVLVIDSLATALGGLFGVSSVTTYVESAAGVAAGARTGLTSVVTGLCFLLALALAPLASLVPPEATASALIIVGFFMFAAVREIDFGNLLDGFPALMTLIMIPLTYSITNGIGAGFITYCFLRAVSGRAREVPPLLWGISAAFVLYFLIPQI
jgi:AGZA family xanthine/uracil permease-like MFS transporter